MDLQVTIHAVHLVVGDVRLVNELVVVSPRQIVHAVVAHAATFGGNGTVTPNQVRVAECAVDPPLIREIVVKFQAAAKVEIFFGNLVTPGTSP